MKSWKLSGIGSSDYFLVRQLVFNDSNVGFLGNPLMISDFFGGYVYKDGILLVLERLYTWMKSNTN